MSFLKYLFRKEKVDEAIVELENNLKILPDTVNEIVDEIVTNKFRGRELSRTEKLQVDQIRSDLIKKYSDDLSYKISLLKSMEESLKAI